MRPLTPSDREALDLRWGKLRTAAQQAEAASAAWNVANDELMAKWQAEGLDDLAISQNKAINLRLNDAWGLYSFFAGEVQRYSADIQAELAYRTLIGAMAETAPSWPAAADRTVPSPGRRPRPYHPGDDADVLGGLVQPGPLTDPALAGRNGSPTGPSPSGLPHVSGPVGGKRSTVSGETAVDLGAAGLRGPAAPIATHAGPGWCPNCGAAQGDEHQLSCNEVSPEQFRAFLGGA